MLKLSLLACLCSLCSLVSADLELTEPGQQGAVVPVGEVGVEDRGQRQGARHHPEDGQHPGQAQAGAGHGHWQLNTEPVGWRASLQISRPTLNKHGGFSTLNQFTLS